MVALPGIEVRDCWGCVVGSVPVEHVGDHFAGDVVIESFNLFSNVAYKASLDQRLIIMMRNMGHPPRNIAIAMPEQMECVPVSSAVMWRVSSPIAKMAPRSSFLICLEVMCSMRWYCQMAEIGVSLLAPVRITVRIIA
jgi:hypothetical protein